MGISRLHSVSSSPYHLQKRGRPLAFGFKSPQDQIKEYQQQLPAMLAMLRPQDRQETLENLRKTIQEIEEPTRQMVIKQPGQNVWYSIYDPLMQISRDDAVKNGMERPQGLFSNDMQHLDHFLLRPSGNAQLKLERKTDISDQQAGIAGLRIDYSLENNPDVKIQRTQTIDPVGNLHEQFHFINKGKQDIEFNLEAGSSAKDIFQARFLDASDVATKVQYYAHQVGEAGEIELQAEHSPLPKDFPVGTTELPAPNTIRTRLIPDGRYEEFKVKDERTANMRIRVPAGGQVTNGISVSVSTDVSGAPQYMPEMYRKTWDSFETSLEVKADNRNMSHLPQMWTTAFKDLRMLTLPVKCGNTYFYPAAAGIPNFVAPFGRDSIITALQIVQINPLLARDTLAALAYYQGAKNDPYTEEEPGKIMHELRVGELARMKQVPHQPFYGTLDATPLFVMLFADYMRRTSDKTIERVLWPNVMAALNWIESQVVSDPKNPLYGFLVARNKDFAEDNGAQGLKNIGWKDSGPATRHIVQGGEEGHALAKLRKLVALALGKTEDPAEKQRLEAEQKKLDGQGDLGRLDYATYPLALAEVQAYLYGAWLSAAYLYRQNGLEADAMRYEQKAYELKKRFNEKFWMPEENFMAMALQGDGSQLKSVASNGAQSLLTGIVEYDKARGMADRLMKSDMVSGWGVRTLSADAPAYNPMAYHNGTIWPHDNSLIIKGLALYGFKDAVSTLATQLLKAGGKFPDTRLPELYSGLPGSDSDQSIIKYPNTCSPQAWASGTMPLILASMLGLRIDEAAKRIIISHPVLPEHISEMKLTVCTNPKSFQSTWEMLPNEDIECIEQLNPTAKTVKEIDPERKATLLLRRNPDNSISVIKLSSSPGVTIQVNDPASGFKKNIFKAS